MPEGYEPAKLVKLLVTSVCVCGMHACHLK